LGVVGHGSELATLCLSGSWSLYFLVLARMRLQSSASKHFVMSSSTYVVTTTCIPALTGLACSSESILRMFAKFYETCEMRHWSISAMLYPFSVCISLICLDSLAMTAKRDGSEAISIVKYILIQQ
jgi:hypothetical protein